MPSNNRLIDELIRRLKDCWKYSHRHCRRDCRCVSYPLMDVLREACYRLRCRLWHRYNTVVCRDLPSTWHDRDDLLLHTAFQILEDFIQKEQPWQFTGDVYAGYLECGEERALLEQEEWATIRELYDWWQDYKHQVEMGLFFDDYREQNQMLHKLIDIRGNLWT